MEAPPPEVSASYCNRSVPSSCMAEGRKIGHCAECKMRLCAFERGLATCAACPDYACEQLTAFFQMVPQARVNLEALR